MCELGQELFSTWCAGGTLLQIAEGLWRAIQRGSCYFAILIIVISEYSS
jgi:hypothetical protein